jgi:DNA-binding IclR family transcriptional regulator
LDTAQTADYALRTLLELERSDGQTIAEVAGVLSLNRTVAQRIMATLHRRGAVLRDLDNRYWLGPLLTAIAHNTPDELAIVAAPVVRELAGRTAETVIVARDEDDESVIVARENGRQSPLRVEYEVGFRQPLSRGATSLAILAFRDPANARRLVAEGDLAQLARIRDEGYAHTEGQIRADMIGLAAPIFDGDDVVGSLGIVLPSARSERVPDLIPELREASATLSAVFRRHAADRGAGDAS